MAKVVVLIVGAYVALVAVLAVGWWVVFGPVGLLAGAAVFSVGYVMSRLLHL